MHLTKKWIGPPEIVPNDIDYDPVDDLLGDGSYGTVYKGRCRGQDVAVKIPNKQNLTKEELASFTSEVYMMSKNSHPNVIMLLGACTEPGKLLIVTEMCRTDLERELAEKLDLSLFARMKMARDAALGMNWLHEITKTIHRDLKPANLLIDYNNQVKVSDFGFSQVRTVSLITDKPKGSLVWMAPEVIFNNPYNEKIDVYSFGIILWEIVTRLKPYTHHVDRQTFCEAICYRHERPPIPPNMPESLKSLITNCWSADPSVRYPFSMIVFKLSEIMVECAIESREAINMWRKYFLVPELKLNEKVEWSDFCRRLLAELGYEIEEDSENSFFLFNLKQLLVCYPYGEDLAHAKGVVTMDRFDKLTKWFGPFFDHQKGRDVIQQINQLMETSWFHGDVSAADANSRLTRLGQKGFLIRLSSNDPKRYPFSLSLEGDVHRRIERVAEGYKCSGEFYSDLYDLVTRNKDTLQCSPPKSYTVLYV